MADAGACHFLSDRLLVETMPVWDWWGAHQDRDQAADCREQKLPPTVPGPPASRGLWEGASALDCWGATQARSKAEAVQSSSSLPQFLRPRLGRLLVWARAAALDWLAGTQARNKAPAVQSSSSLPQFLARQQAADCGTELLLWTAGTPLKMEVARPNLGRRSSLPQSPACRWLNARAGQQGGSGWVARLNAASPQVRTARRPARLTTGRAA